MFEGQSERAGAGARAAPIVSTRLGRGAPRTTWLGWVARGAVAAVTRGSAGRCAAEA
jgi:hypothetical protein